LRKPAFANSAPFQDENLCSYSFCDDIASLGPERVEESINVKDQGN